MLQGELTLAIQDRMAAFMQLKQHFQEFESLCVKISPNPLHEIPFVKTKPRKVYTKHEKRCGFHLGQNSACTIPNFKKH